MNEEIRDLSIKGIDHKKIDKYNDYINYYSNKEKQIEETEEKIQEDYTNVLKVLKNG